MRKDLLRAFAAPVHRKGDALIEKREIGFLLAAVQLFRWEILKLRIEIAVLWTGASPGAEHFVISCVDLIIREGRRDRSVGGLCWHGHIPTGNRSTGNTAREKSYSPSIAPRGRGVLRLPSVPFRTDAGYAHSLLDEYGCADFPYGPATGVDCFLRPSTSL